MQVTLTHQQEDAINNTVNTHDYTTRYEADEEDEVVCDHFTAVFEADTSVLERSIAHDVGGIIIYMQGDTLVAYYDYENMCGTVFS